MTEAARSRGFLRKMACCCTSAAMAGKSGRCWKNWGGYRCSLASKAAMSGRCLLRTANHRVPMEDDCLESRGQFAPVSSPADSNYRNRPGRGRD